MGELGHQHQHCGMLHHSNKRGLEEARPFRHSQVLFSTFNNDGEPNNSEDNDDDELVGSPEELQ
jgi:hypothetical protein